MNHDEEEDCLFDDMVIANPAILYGGAVALIFLIVLLVGIFVL